MIIDNHFHRIISNFGYRLRALIWTPLTKLDPEGLVLNMNDNNKTTLQNWAKGQPNGGKYESAIVIVAAQMALADSVPYWPSCSSCRISNMLLLQMDGLCTDSLIGYVRIII